MIIKLSGFISIFLSIFTVTISRQHFESINSNHTPRKENGGTNRN